MVTDWITTLKSLYNRELDPTTMNRILFFFITFSILISSIFLLKAGTGDKEFDFQYRVNEDLFSFWPSYYFEYNKTNVVVIGRCTYTSNWVDSDGTPMSGMCSIVKQYSGPTITDSFKIFFPFNLKGFFHGTARYSLYDSGDLASSYSFLGIIAEPVNGTVSTLPSIELLMNSSLEKDYLNTNMPKVIELNREFLANWGTSSIKNFNVEVKDDKVFDLISLMKGDPILAYFQIQVYLRENTLSSYTTFKRLLSLFDSREIRRAVEQFGAFFGNDEIRNHLFEDISKDSQVKTISRSQLIDIRILCECANKWDTVKCKSLDDFVTARLKN